jgi:hypothetical protein
MRWDARGTIALLVSALVGITAGAIVGVTTSTGGPGSAEPGGPTGSPSASASATDPLGLGIPLVNLDCTGQKILVVGYGDDAGGELSNAVSANADRDVKYLEPSKSCNTLYGAANQVPPTYVAYLGPYDTNSGPCAEQMTPAHARDTVTNLKPGIRIHVECLCVLEPAARPRLKLGMDATTKDGVYIRAMQQQLADIDYLGPRHVTGVYDQKTSNVVDRLKEVNAIPVDTPGLVDKQTWLMLRDRACQNYDF